MAQFTITITDSNALAGLTWAVTNYNTANPKNPVDAAGYMSLLVNNAANSYVTGMHDEAVKAAMASQVPVISTPVNVEDTTPASPSPPV